MFKKLRIRLYVFTLRLRTYFRRLLFPLYLFPLKLFTYSLYYLLRFIGRFTWSLILIIRDTLVFPFRSLKNFLKSLFIIALILYIPASLFVIFDYLLKEYPSGLRSLSCSMFNNIDGLPINVTRIVGYGYGSGFFISPDQVLTNYHVIEGSASPKLILPDDSIAEIATVSANMKEDLAILTTKEQYPDLVYQIGDSYDLAPGEELVSQGYAWEAGIERESIALIGTYSGTRNNDNYDYVLTNIGLVHGMSGGPLLDRCGSVVGVNTAGVGGLSMFISSDRFKSLWPTFTSDGLIVINVDPSKSPIDGVIAFYTYLGARNMQEGYKLLSQSYLDYTNYEEWTSRFENILDVSIVKTEPVVGEENTVFVKFVTTTLENSELAYHFYEGVWVTVLEDDVYKMRRSMIKEVDDPPYSWQWTGPEF